MCLSNPYTSKVPNSQEKKILYKTGLGMNKIKFFSDDGEEDVYKKLTSEYSENGGFPKLKDCGGFKLLQCTANCRDLEVLKCAMSVKVLKNHIGGQGKIYLRPIQRRLSTITLVRHGHESKIKEKCSVCSDMFYVKDLRKHFFTLCPSALLEEDEFESFTDTSEGTGQTADSVSSNSIKYHQNIEPSLHAEDLVSEEAVPAIEDDSSLVADTVDLTNASPESEKVSLVEMDIDSRIDVIIESYKSSGYIQNPVQILKYLQEKLITARPLEILDPASCEKGDTNLIMVDRESILETGFVEILALKDKFTTLEVQFYGEVSLFHYIVFSFL